MEERFYGFCFPEPGTWHTPSVTLNTPEEVYRYTQLHGRTGIFREVRVTDSDDFMVVQMIDGKYTWPEEWKQLNKEEASNEAGEAANEEAENHDCSSEGAGAGELVGGTGNADTACVDSSKIWQTEDDQ
ncbi:hypothetical protein NST28_22620 [Paenibacillus sp. FSL R10-2791]|uniref:hypothetical protein n=1 Tax=Paenibacillus sp. FSL R10-2791 TaxID=2954695 RepID=UPI0030F8C544